MSTNPQQPSPSPDPSNTLGPSDELSDDALEDVSGGATASLTASASKAPPAPGGFINVGRQGPG